MNRSTGLVAALLPATLVAALVAPAAAAPADSPAAAGTTPAVALHGPRALRADAEIDPTAYALAGNSLHVGIGYRHLRLDLGNFAMALPAFAHADDGFAVRFTGYGAKTLPGVREAIEERRFADADTYAVITGNALAAYAARLDAATAIVKGR